MTKTRTVLPLDTSVLDLVVTGRHGDPHGVLGAHVYNGAVTVRAFRPLADSVVVVSGSTKVPLTHEHEGVWAGVLDVPDVPDYRIEVTYAGGPAVVTDDPYRYLPTLGELDLHLINEGRHERLWDVLGAHVRTYDSPTGAVTRDIRCRRLSPLPRQPMTAMPWKPTCAGPATTMP